MKQNKDIYREFCLQEKNIPLFSEAWWLDAACGEDNWDVVLVTKEDKIIGSLPYYKQKKLGLTLLNQPPLTQKLGPWIRYDRKFKPEKLISYQNNIIDQLIDQLPPFHLFMQNFNYDVTNWLSFYWKGFKQKTSYTYVIEDISDVEKVLSSFSQSKRNDVKKAKKEVSVEFDMSAENFYEFHKKSLAKQNKKISYDFNLFQRLYNAGYSKDAAKTIYAIDSEGKTHAALFIVWNKHCAYYLLNALDPDHRHSSSVSLLVLEIINFLNRKTKSFDFEGSMIKGVERSYRNFGTVQKQLFSISKFNSSLLKIYARYKGIID